MELISIETATHTAVANALDLSMTVKDGDNELTGFPFTYHPDDTASMTLAVKNYLTAHPELTINNYVAPAITDTQVDIERDRRIALPLSVSIAQPSGTPLVFNVNMDERSLRNINGLATGAVIAKMANNADTEPFITYENTTVNLTPDDIISLGLQVKARVSAMTFASRILKDTAGGIPQNYTDDSYWTST